MPDKTNTQARVGRQILRTERATLLPTSTRRDTVVPFNPGTRAAVTGSAISAISSLTPGSGTVTLYEWDGTVLVAGDTVTAYNMWSVAVAASTKIQVAWIQGDWFVSAENCP